MAFGMVKPLGAESTVSRILGMELRSQLESGVLSRRTGKAPFAPAAAPAAATAAAAAAASPPGMTGAAHSERGAEAMLGELTMGGSTERPAHFLLAMCEL